MFLYGFSVIRPLSVVAALAIVVMAFFSAAPARAVGSASTDQFGVVSVGSPATDVGKLTVVLYSNTPITAVTTHLVASGSSVDALDPALTEITSSSTGPSYIESTWSVAMPIT